jgi:hypothetical protein
MKLDSIFFTPKAEVSFTSAEYELMLECSAVHYDGVCKDVGKEKLFNGEAGMLWRAHRIHINTGHQSVTFTFRELDTLAKILEMGHCLPDYMSRSLLIGQLQATLSKTLQALNESTPKSIVDPLKRWVPTDPHDIKLHASLNAELAARIQTEKEARASADPPIRPKRDEGGARYSDLPWNEG